MAGIQKRKASRKKVKPKLGLGGSSGSGKTYSSLRMAYGYTGDWSKICLIDTEGGRGELYANTNIRGIEIGEYDYIRLDPPFTPQRYIDAIKLAEDDPNIEVIILDSMSHAWAGSGGMLDMQNAYSKDSKENSFTAWRKVTPEHNRLVDTVLRSRCAVFLTVRTKTEYVIQEENGKKVPKKIGMAPVFRDGLEYEMTVFMDLSQEHYANATKDNTGVFEGVPFIPTEEEGKKLREWLETGKDEPKPDYKQLYIAGKEKGLSDEDVKLILSSKYKVESSKDLNIEQFNEALQGIKNTPDKKLKEAVEKIKANIEQKGA